PFRDAPISAEAFALEVPEQPLPGQRLAPCPRSGEVEINGGCWVRQANISPPCDHEEYEWRGACYRPALKRPRPPTTKKP
ncbi:MAG: serine/threonine protein kinase, partial [Myxococcaceae bacterium]|nr:serine/threonine protein kinase [Myxococcaceae bacterium]